MQIESPPRVQSILSTLYNSFDKARIDPILSVFTTSTELKDYYYKRLFEIIKTSLQEEQETILLSLTNDNENLNNTISELKNEIYQLRAGCEAIPNENSDTHSSTSLLEQEIKKRDQQNSYGTSIVNQLQCKVKQFHEENTKLNDLVNATEYKSNEFEKEGLMKKNEIKYIKESCENIKVKHDEINENGERMIKKNNEGSTEINRKNKEIYELVNKIEEIKLEFQSRCYEFDKKVERGEWENKNVLSVKIQALKKKLREKIEIIHELTENDTHKNGKKHEKGETECKGNKQKKNDYDDVFGEEWKEMIPRESDKRRGDATEIHNNSDKNTNSHISLNNIGINTQ